VFAVSAACVSRGAEPEVREIIASAVDPISLQKATAALGARFPDAAVEDALLEMAASDPRFARGQEAREWLIKVMVRTPLSSKGFVPFSAPVQRLLIAELQDGSPRSRGEIFGWGSIRKFTPDHYDDLRRAAWAALPSAEYAAMLGGLRVLSLIGAPDPWASDMLRPCITDPERTVAPEIVRERGLYAPFDAWHAIRTGAASAFLRCSVDPLADIAWLSSLKGDAASAARDAVVIEMGPERMLETAEPQVQRALVDALLRVVRSTLDVRPLSQDEFAVFVSLGERFPQFRQEVGDFLRERLDDDASDARRESGIREVLERWSTTP